MKNLETKYKLKFLVVSFFAFSLTFTNLESPATASVKQFVIAYQGPLSGEEAPIGNGQFDAVKYAVHLFNDAFKEKFNVSIVNVDDLGSGVEAIKVAPSVAANSNVIGVVGPAYSGATIASLPVYKQANLPMISPSATRVSLTDPSQGLIGFPVFHRVAMIDEQQGQLLYQTAIDGVQSPRVFLIDDQSPYSIGLVQYIVNIPGAAIVASDSVSDRTTDWSAVIAKIRAANSNVVIFSGYYPQASTLFRQLRDSGYTGVLAGGDGVFSPGILNLAPYSVLEGVRLTSGTLPSLSQLNQNLENSFREVIKRPSEYFAAETIDATNVLLTCIAKGSETRSQMLACIDTFSGISISGRSYSFDSNGDISGPSGYSLEIKSGVFRLRDNLGMARKSFEELISNFPWYSIKKKDADEKAKAEEQAKVKQDAEAKAKAEVIARTLRDNKEACLNLNTDLNQTKANIRNAALIYPTYSKVFEDLFKNLPQSLDCDNLDILSFASNFSTQRELLNAYKLALVNGISFAELAVKQQSGANTVESQKKTTITCIKGKVAKKVTGTNPRCPSGFKKK